MKPKMLLLFLTLFCHLFSFTLEPIEISPEEIEQYEKDRLTYQSYIDDVNELRSRFEDQMREELGLLCSGNRGRMHGTIEELGVDFVAKRRATEEEARALILFVIDRFVEAINGCEKIRPYLEGNLFTYENVKVSIAFQGINGRHADGTIAWVSSTCGSANPPNQNCIFYSTEDPFKFESIDLLMESRETALEKNRSTTVQNPSMHHETEKEKAIDQFIHDFWTQMAKKHRFECWSMGGEMKDTIEEVGARFIVLRRASQEQARLLMLDLANSLLKALNSQETLKPYFVETPFPLNRLKLYLGFRKKNYYSYSDGSMQRVVLENGEISYFREIPKGEEDKYDTSSMYALYAKESYEEATEHAQKASQLSWYKKLLPKLFNTST